MAKGQVAKAVSQSAAFWSISCLMSCMHHVAAVGPLWSILLAEPGFGWLAGLW